MAGKFYKDLFARANEVPIEDLWDHFHHDSISAGATIRSPYRDDRNPSLQIGGSLNIIKDYGSSLPDGQDQWSPVALVMNENQMEAKDAAIWILQTFAPGKLEEAEAPKLRAGGKKPYAKWTTETVSEILAENYAAQLPEFVQFLRVYGLDDQTIQRAKISAAVSESPGKCWVVYAECLGQNATSTRFVKGKSLDRNTEGKRDARLFFGESYFLWCPFDPVPNKPLIIGGGEEKAMLLGQEFPESNALGLTGGEVSRLKPEDLELIKSLNPSEIVLAYDSDETGKLGMLKHAKQIRATHPDVPIRIVKWCAGSKPRKPGYDVNDMFQNEGRDALIDLIATAAPFEEFVPTTEEADEDKEWTDKGTPYSTTVLTYLLSDGRFVDRSLREGIKPFFFEMEAERTMYQMVLNHWSSFRTNLAIPICRELIMEEVDLKVQQDLEKVLSKIESIEIDPKQFEYYFDKFRKKGIENQINWIFGTFRDSVDLNDDFNESVEKLIYRTQSIAPSLIGTREESAADYNGVELPVFEDFLDGLVPGGVVNVAGYQKEKKSFFCMAHALCSCLGLEFAGHPVKRGSVTYLLGDDTKQRLITRLRMMTRALTGQHAVPLDEIQIPDNFHFYTAPFPSSQKGGFGWLESICIERPDTSCIYIDMVESFKSPRTSNLIDDKQDWADFYARLRHICETYRTDIVLVHHKRKPDQKTTSNTKHDVYGSTGIVGGADSTVLISLIDDSVPQSEQEFRLKVVGNDSLENSEKIFKFVDGMWVVSDRDPKALCLSHGEQKLKDWISNSSEPLDTQAAVGWGTKELGKGERTVKGYLKHLVESGHIAKVGHGQYWRKTFSVVPTSFKGDQEYAVGEENNPMVYRFRESPEKQLDSILAASLNGSSSG